MVNEFAMYEALFTDKNFQTKQLSESRNFLTRKSQLYGFLLKLLHFACKNS